MTTNYTSSYPRITITAGMDHDEYAGIEAAKILQKRYLAHPNITVVPLDYAPTDGHIPKLVFPGKAQGKLTAQKMHWLYETHIKNSNLWIDLHGGSTTEQLTPFVWMYQSKHARIQKIYQSFIHTTSAPIVVYDINPFMNYSKFLDSKGIAYIMMECGDQGKTRKKDIETHVRWVDECLGFSHSSTKPTLYTNVHYEFQKTEKSYGQLLWKSVDPQYKNGNLYAAFAVGP